MKRLTIALLSLALTMPALAQYGRPRYYNPPRPHAAPSHHYTPDIYYGLRLGAAFATVSSDDIYLDGGSLKTGLNVGAVVGF